MPALCFNLIESIKRTTVRVEVISLISTTVTLGPSFAIKPSHSLHWPGLSIITGPPFVIEPRSKSVTTSATCDKCDTKVNFPKQLPIHRDSRN